MLEIAGIKILLLAMEKRENFLFFHSKQTLQGLSDSICQHTPQNKGKEAILVLKA